MELTIADVAKELGLNAEHVRRLVRERTLEGTKFGKKWLVSRRSVDAYRQGGRMERLKLACAWTTLVTDAVKAQDLERLLRATFALTDAEVVDLLAAWRQTLRPLSASTLTKKAAAVVDKQQTPSAVRALGMAAGVNR